MLNKAEKVKKKMQTGFSVYNFHVYTINTCQTRDNVFCLFSKAIAFCCDCPASGNLKQFGKYQININIKKYSAKNNLENGWEK